MKNKHNQGFSLVELIIAIAILALIMVALASFMNTTTGIYTRTRNDTELQKTGQEVYNMISDKIMQASEIRIGCDGKEYVAVGSNGTNYATAAGKLYIQGSDGKLTDPTVSSTGRPLYAFFALQKQTGDDKKSVDYISILYEQKSNVNIGANAEHKQLNNPYQQVLDVYYFTKPSESSDTMNIYLYRKYGAYRADSIYAPASGNTEYAQNTDTANRYIESGSATKIDMNTDVPELNDDLLSNEDVSLVCKNISGVYAYALPRDNSLNLTMNSEKQTIENTDQGMIRIRNSYVLNPQNAKFTIENSSEDDSSEDTSSES